MHLCILLIFQRQRSTIAAQEEGTCYNSRPLRSLKKKRFIFTRCTSFKQENKNLQEVLMLELSWVMNTEIKC